MYLYECSHSNLIVWKSVGQGTQNMNDLQFFYFSQGLDAPLANINIFPTTNELTKPILYFKEFQEIENCLMKNLPQKQGENWRHQSVFACNVSEELCIIDFLRSCIS